MMRYRPHRGSLTDSMAKCVELPATMKALRKHLEITEQAFIDVSTIDVQPYGAGPDKRIGWDRTCIVTAKWRDGPTAPVGFTDTIPELG